MILEYIINGREQWKSDFEARKGVLIMLCMVCGANAKKGYTTDVTELGNGLVIVRNVPCYKCQECNAVIYTADVVEKLKRIVNMAKRMMQEIAIIDYPQVA